MTINSAHELHDLINALSVQFSQQHQHAAQQLWSQVDQHLRHVADEGGSWISQEIHLLIEDWEGHKRAVQAAQQWFEHHGQMLLKVAQEPLTLAGESFGGAAVGAVAATGASLVALGWRNLVQPADDAGFVLGAPAAIGTWAKWLKAPAFSGLAKSGVLKDMGAAGSVLSTTAHIAKFDDDVISGHKVAAVSDGMRTVGDVLKAAGGDKPSFNPIYGAGFLFSEYADVVDAAGAIDWKQGIPAPTWQNITQDYVPAFAEAGEEVLGKIGSWF